jgi:hypothetical protein
LEGDVFKLWIYLSPALSHPMKSSPRPLTHHRSCYTSIVKNDPSLKTTGYSWSYALAC